MLTQAAATPGNRADRSGNHFGSLSSDCKLFNTLAVYLQRGE